jgi:hypothetical protein
MSPIGRRKPQRYTAQGRRHDSDNTECFAQLQPETLKVSLLSEILSGLFCVVPLFEEAQSYLWEISQFAQ